MIAVLLLLGVISLFLGAPIGNGVFKVATSFYPQWSAGRLLLLAVIAVPSFVLLLDSLAFLALLVSEAASDPLDDAPQRGFWMLQLLLLPFCFASIPCGYLGARLALRRRRIRERPDLETFK